jgi:cadmium resistance protein CadD (predicted permease)
MELFLTLLVVSVAAFASTNIDGVFVLVGFFADPRIRARQVVVGQYAGIAALYAASGLASLLSIVVSPAYIGLLGLAPVFIGVKKLCSGWRSSRMQGELEGHARAAARGGGMTVAIVTIANGGDNLGTYIPLFSTRSPVEIGVIGLVFVVMTGIWCLFAHWLVHHRELGAPVRRYGHRIVPFVLIGIGIFILNSAGSLQLGSQLLRSMHGLIVKGPPPASQARFSSGPDTRGDVSWPHRCR